MPSAQRMPGGTHGKRANTEIRGELHDGIQLASHVVQPRGQIPKLACGKVPKFDTFDVELLAGREDLFRVPVRCRYAGRKHHDLKTMIPSSFRCLG